MTATIASFYPEELTVEKNHDPCIRVTYKEKKYVIPQQFFDHDHPGGKMIIRRFKNGDITDAFDSAGHSTDAEEMLEEWMEDTTGVDVDKLNERAQKRKEEMDEWRWRSTAIAFTVGTIVTALSLSLRP